jgi:hypothetical protein
VAGLLERIAAALPAGAKADTTPAPAEAADPAASATDALLLRLQSEADRVRAAAKWMLAALGAIGALVIAGIQFTAIGAVPGGWRAVAAIGGAAVAVLAVVVLVGLVLAVMLPGDVTLERLAAGKDRLLTKYLQDNPSVLQGYATAEELRLAYQRALAASKQATERYFDRLRAAGTEADPAVRKAQFESKLADDWLDYLDGLATYVTKRLAVQQLRGRFGIWQRLAALVAAAAIGAGLGFYAWGTNPPKPATPAAGGAHLSREARAWPGSTEPRRDRDPRVEPSGPPRRAGVLRAVAQGAPAPARASFRRASAPCGAGSCRR